MSPGRARAGSATLALALLLAVPLAGCGYRLAGRGSFLPEDIEVIGIPPFDSDVPRSELVQRLTDEVTREFVSRGGYKIVPDRTGADAVLDGRITGLLETPTAFDEDGRATRSLLMITSAVTMRRGKDVLYENPTFQFRTDLEHDPESGQFLDQESEGIEEIARQFARTLVATIVEGF